MWNGIYRKMCKYVDLELLFRKVIIFFFSGMVSIAPIFFIEFDRMINDSNASHSMSSLLEFIISSSDFVYVLVGLSTIVLSDLFDNNRKNGTMKLFCYLFDILAVIFGIFIYTYYKTHNVDRGTIKSLNILCIHFVAILSLLSYINLAITLKTQEESGNEY